MTNERLSEKVLINVAKVLKEVPIDKEKDYFKYFLYQYLEHIRHDDYWTSLNNAYEDLKRSIQH